MSVPAAGPLALRPDPRSRGAARPAPLSSGTRSRTLARRAPARRAAGLPRSSTSAAAPAGSPSGWPSSVTGSPWSTPAPTPWPSSTGGRRRPGSPTGSPASRATSPRCPTWSSAGSVDVVLCHGVLEVVDDPEAALASLAGVLRPGGPLSLLVSQRHAAVVARAMAGHFRQARDLLDGPPPDGAPHRFTAEETDGPARRRRVHRRHPARRPGLQRPRAQLAGRPRARRGRGAGRARAGRRRAARSTSPSPTQVHALATRALTPPDGPA